MKTNKTIPVINKPLVKSANIFPVVGIGASAGGLDAFKKLLKAIPEDSGMAYVLVQHLDPKHESMLPELLQKVTNIPVMEISDDIKVEPDHIYIIPSNKMMIANDGVLELSPRPTKNKNGCNLPIDLFFTSLAEVHQSHAIGVVLSGTATDGTLGLKAIKDHGGITFAQDEASAAYQGMPHSAAKAGVVDFILPPDKIPGKLLEVTSILTGHADTDENLSLEDAEIFKQILLLLRIRKGTDFTYYKKTTIGRRILRRMAINKHEGPDYLSYLRENTTEQDVLYQDLLIPVTSFFRDTKTFDNLCETVFPLIAKNTRTPIRIWVAGCSTGEEAYSIAICLKEFLDSARAGAAERVQIFATDISEPAIAKARSGLYTKNNIAGLTAQRLKEFFTPAPGGYLANKSIRDMCVFATHNFLKDPPFSKMDLTSCRNVLIYMEPHLQKKALSTFHYALNPNGFLLLGKSETTSSVPDFFASAGKGDKLFKRKDVPGRSLYIDSQRTEKSFIDMNTDPKMDNIKTDFQKQADDLMLSKYTPASVVVNEAMDIVHFRGNTSDFLEQAAGKPSHNLLKMAKEGLAFELRNILHKTKRDKIAVQKNNIPLQINGFTKNIQIEAIQLKDTIEPYYLVLFHNNQPDPATSSKKNSPKKQLEESDNQHLLRIKQLETELAQSREDMRSISEEQEATNEELQSGNEELLSGSEELQSLNEELETGKEELQSTNEELLVVNQEMLSLNEQVTAAKDYAEAIIANIHEPLLVLDKQLRIQTANEAFYKTFHVNEKETEGVLIYELGNNQWDIPELRRLLEKILPGKTVFNNFEVSHTFSNIGERVMMLNAREVINTNSAEKLILLSIEDITEKKEIEKFLIANTIRFRQLVKELPAAVYSCDADGRINFYNDAAEKVWGRKPELQKDRWCGSFKLFTADGVPMALEDCPMALALKEGRSISGEELIIERPDGSRSVVRVYPQPERNLAGKITGATNMCFDVTEQVTARKRIEESEKQFRMMAELLPQKVWTSDADGNKNYFNQTLLDYVGFSFDELKGKAWKKIIHPDDWINNEPLWEESVRTGKNYEAENRLLRKDGKYQWHLTQAVALKDEDGKIKTWVGSKTVIQEQREQKEELERSVAERTQELLELNRELKEKNLEVISAREKLLTEYSRSLIEASLDPLITINTAGKITDMNQATIDITGLSREQLTGSNFFDYFTEPAKASEVYGLVFKNGSVINSPLTVRHTDGKLTEVFLNGSVYKDGKGNVLGVVLVARDVTEQNRNATELTEAIVIAEMATVIAEDAKEKAEKAMLTAEEAVKAKQQFLSNMSHEIRTPMNAIIGFTKVIMKTELTVKQREYLTAIKLSGNALIVLINDILDLAKVDSGKMIFEKIPFKMSSSISAMLHLFETKVQEKNLELVKQYDHKIPEVLLGDPVRLHQIILNLVSNAVKFTSKGKIIVSLKLEEEDETSATIKFGVSDTGVGIPADKTEAIFEKFHQASTDTSRLYGGTGLGLAIVKQLVELQGGSIQLKSKMGKGSTFSFRLKFVKTDAKVESENELVEPDPNLRNIKVLVVEDMALNQLLMKTLLDEFGFERDIAANGKIAIEKLEARSYDIILMDLQMPEMNGFEATDHIRNKMKLNIPIIALTADVTTVDLAKCKAVGMNDYIPKPVDERILYSKIVSLVQKPLQKKQAVQTADKHPKPTNIRCTDLAYLTGITRANPVLMMEMLAIYMAQTPTLIASIKKSLQEKDWKGFGNAAHKLIPSFGIMGMSPEYASIAKQMQEYDGTQMPIPEIEGMFLKLEQVCAQACEELAEEFNTLKNTHA